jgi:lysylphosphatidylglycerol synthetase-like protein (DUF2156 family)
MSPYNQQANATSHLLATPVVLETLFIITTTPTATSPIPDTEGIIPIPSKTTAAAAAVAAAAVVAVAAAAVAAAAKKIRLIVQAAVAAAVVAVAAAAAAAAAAAVKKTMRNRNPVTQETSEHPQSKALRGFPRFEEIGDH